MVGFVFCFWKIMMLACGLERTIHWWTVGPRATHFCGYYPFDSRVYRLYTVVWFQGLRDPMVPRTIISLLGTTTLYLVSTNMVLKWYFVKWGHPYNM